jgi:hypothetical protein
MSETKSSIDAYDAQEILRCIEATYIAESSRQGHPCDALSMLAEKWARLMFELEITRFGSHQMWVTLKSELPASVDPVDPIDAEELLR